MAFDKKKLRDTAKASVRPPDLGRLLAADKKKNYRVVAISLYLGEASWVDEMSRMLKQAGFPRANRSLVIQELIRMGQEQLSKNEEDLLRFFRDRLAKRLPSLEPTTS